MRGHVDSLIDRYADGVLSPRKRTAVEKHLAVCGRCALEARAAEKLAGTLRGMPAVRAPDGFLDEVMSAVHRESLKSGEGAGVFYRRLGLSFVLTAAVLAASLLLPSLSYARIIKINALSAAVGGAKPSFVKGILEEAGVAVRETLGSPGGRVSMHEGGASR